MKCTHTQSMKQKHGPNAHCWRNLRSLAPLSLDEEFYGILVGWLACICSFWYRTGEVVKKHSVLRSRRCKNKVGGLLEEDQMQCLSEVNALWSAIESHRDDVIEGSSCLDSGHSLLYRPPLILITYSQYPWRVISMNSYQHQNITFM